MLLNSPGILCPNSKKPSCVYFVYVVQSLFKQSFLAAHIIYKHTPQKNQIGFTTVYQPPVELEFVVIVMTR